MSPDLCPVGLRNKDKQKTKVSMCLPKICQNIYPASEGRSQNPNLFTKKWAKSRNFDKMVSMAFCVTSLLWEGKTLHTSFRRKSREYDSFLRSAASGRGFRKRRFPRFCAVLAALFSFHGGSSLLQRSQGQRAVPPPEPPLTRNALCRTPVQWFSSGVWVRKGSPESL